MLFELASTSFIATLFIDFSCRCALCQRICRHALTAGFLKSLSLKCGSAYLSGIGVPCGRFGIAYSFWRTRVRLPSSNADLS